MKGGGNVFGLNKERPGDWRGYVRTDPSTLQLNPLERRVLLEDLPAGATLSLSLGSDTLRGCSSVVNDCTRALDKLHPRRRSPPSYDSTRDSG